MIRRDLGDAECRRIGDKAGEMLGLSCRLRKIHQDHEGESFKTTSQRQLHQERVPLNLQVLVPLPPPPAGWKQPVVSVILVQTEHPWSVTLPTAGGLRVHSRGRHCRLISILQPH